MLMNTFLRSHSVSGLNLVGHVVPMLVNFNNYGFRGINHYGNYDLQFSGLLEIDESGRTNFVLPDKISLKGHFRLHSVLPLTPKKARGSEKKRR